MTRAAELAGAGRADISAAGDVACDEARRALSSMADTGELALGPALRAHVDSCPECWDQVVATRWAIAAPSRDVQELREYLGESFTWGVDSSWLLAHEWESRNRSTLAQVEDFYRSTEWYVYNLVVWEASGQRPPYVDRAAPVVAAHGIRSVLDFGAGVGTDSLKLDRLGLTVTSCDFDNAASRFLRWRVARRGADVSFVNTDDPAVVGAAAADMVWAMDVIEHLPDPAATLSPALEHASLFVYCTEHSGNSGGRHPFHFRHDPAELQAAWRRLGFHLDRECSKVSGLRVFAKARCSARSDERQQGGSKA